MTTSPGQELVLSNLQDGVLCVEFNRPERRNALSLEMERAYVETMLAAADDPAVRVIVLTGRGPAFCAGLDLTLLEGLASGAPRAAKLRRHAFLTELPKPVLAAVNGAAIGAGFVMALMCDLRFVGAGTKIGAGTARLGLPAEYGTDWLLARSVGLARAFEILASGRLYSGAEAERLGLANQVFPDDELLPRTLEFARELASQCSPRSLAMIKRQLNRCLTGSLEAAYALGERLIVRSVTAPDFQEAMAARQARRAPVYPGLGPATEWWTD